MFIYAIIIQEVKDNVIYFKSLSDWFCDVCSTSTRTYSWLLRLTVSFFSLYRETSKADLFGGRHPSACVDPLWHPGTDSSHTHLSDPFCLPYVSAVVGNGALILVLCEYTLYELTPVFLSMPVGTDVLLCIILTPKATGKITQAIWGWSIPTSYSY